MAALFSKDIQVKNFLPILFIVLSGCTHIVQPQSFVKHDKDLFDAPVVLSSHLEDDFFYSITRFNGERLAAGDYMRGALRISEVHADAGDHDITIAANFVVDSAWKNAYQDTFTGTIRCNLERSYFYTIGPHPQGASVSKSALNYLPVVVVGQFIAGDGVVDKEGDLKLACIKHKDKPARPYVASNIEMSEEFYTP